MVALDLYPGIPKKSITEAIAKETSESVIKNILKAKVFKNATDDVIEPLAKRFAKIEDAKVIQKEIEEVGRVAQKAEAIPKELQPLAQEARKYKSAEEFVTRSAFGQPSYVMTAQSGLFKDLSVKYSQIMQDLAKTGKLTPEKTVELGKQMDIEKRKILTDFYTQATKGVTQKVAETQLETVQKAGKQPSQELVPSASATSRFSLPKVYKETPRMTRAIEKTATEVKDTVPIARRVVSSLQSTRIGA